METVKNDFGRVKSSPLTVEEKEAIVALYRTGEGIRYIARKFKRSYGAVHNAVDEAGIMRPRSARTPKEAG